MGRSAVGGTEFEIRQLKTNNGLCVRPRAVRKLINLRAVSKNIERRGRFLGKITMREVPDFVIPSDKDQLLHSGPGDYRVRNVYPPGEIEAVLAETHSILRNEGPGFILDHFDEFFSVVVHSSKLSLPVHVSAYERIYNCLDMFVEELGAKFDSNQEPSPEDKPSLVTISKMLAYLLCSFVRHIEVAVGEDTDGTQGKRKKTPKSGYDPRWYERTDKLLVLMYQWVNFPLEKLWQPPIADRGFVLTIADICYRILERCKGAKDKPIRESIFQILGVLVKRYNHIMSCVLKVVQLVKICDGLAPHLATGIIQLVEETQSTGIIKEILREVDRATPEEAASRKIGIFLEAIAVSKPELMLPAIDSLTDHLSNECYMMRNCVIGILGTVIKKFFTSENLSEDEKSKRDECLDNLMDHMLDVNAYVRSKVLQVWQNLCSEGAVPLAVQNDLLKATILRLDDKSAIVRKYAFQLLRTLLQCNPFAGKFNYEELVQQLKDAKSQLKVMKLRTASISKPGAQIRMHIWRRLAPALPEIIAKIPAEEYSKNDGEEITDLDGAFEGVRQLLLEGKIEEAVESFIMITSKLPEASNLNSMTSDAREAYLISVLHKVFMESQEAECLMETEEEGDVNKLSERDKEIKKRQEAYESQAALVEYIKNCSIFAMEVSKAVPIAEIRLNSVSPSDAIESVTFLVVAYKFRIRGAKAAVRSALYQVFYPDVSVCENLAEAYKELYIGDERNYQTERQKALVIVKTLIRILKNLEPGDSPALAKLVGIWREKKVLSPEVLQVMWERFSLKLPDTTPEESRAALTLLTMASMAEPAIVTDNLDVLLAVGLGPRAEGDLLLARDTCRAMTKVQVQNADPLKCPARFPNEHEAFTKLMSLLVTKFQNIAESCYTVFCNEAINAIYHLADQPNVLMKELLRKLRKYLRPVSGSSRKVSMASPLLANLLHIVGHVAIREMIHLDVVVYQELKRRSTLTEMAKEKRKADANNARISISGNRNIRENESDVPSSASRSKRNKNASTLEDNGEEALEGATADDMNAELIYNILEHEVITGKGLLVKFVPMVMNICQHPEKYRDEQVQIAGALALSKMMTVSSIFCKNWLQLLITIMERSPSPSNRSNILVGLTDLMNRFPNEVEPWTKHIYGRLRDDARVVRLTCVKMLSKLIMSEMVRVKGQVSELAICLVDSEEDIRQETTEFFNELANKGNALYNIMPDILSRLTDPGLNLEEDKFRFIIKFILGLLQKEKQVDSIIEKVCARLQLANTERQWRDTSYCLSLLKFNAKGIRRLTDSLDNMKDIVHYDPVLKVLQYIIEQAKKKPETKTVCIELEEKLEKMLSGNDCEADKSNSEVAAMPPPTVMPDQRRSKRSKRRARKA